MKICVISENKYGCGASIAAYRLAEALSKAGHNIQYLYCNEHETPSDPNFKMQHISRSLLESVTYVIMSKIDKKAAFDILRERFYGKIKDIIDDFQPDIINLHNVGTILRHKDITKLGMDYPIIWTMHDCFAVKPFVYRFKDYYGKINTVYLLDKSMLNQFERNQLIESNSNIQFVTPSKWLYDSIQDVINGNKKVHIIPNGISQYEWFPQNKESCRKDLNLNQNDFYCLFVANRIFYERKNIRVLLESLEMLDDLPITALALGKKDKSYEIYSKKIKYFTPDFKSDTINKLFSAADVFIIPSLIDNLPNVVLESLFCGTPVIGADTGGIPEMVIPRKTGWLFDPRNPKELAKLISEIYRNKEEIKEFSKNCMLLSSDKFTAEKQVKTYIELFMNTIANDT